MILMLIDFTLLVYNCVIKVRRTNSVIIMTHQPDWLLDWYENGDSRKDASDYQSNGNNVSDLICNILKEMCKLRIAGDIHHYMHHSVVRSDELDNSQPKKNEWTNLSPTSTCKWLWWCICTSYPCLQQFQ